MPLAASIARRAFLPPGTARILRAVIAATRPRGHGLDQPIEEEVLTDVVRFLPHLATPPRVALTLGLYLIEAGPPLFARRWRRFSALPQQEATRYLAGCLEAGGLRGAIVSGLRALIFISFYQHPSVLAALGVDWESRAQQLTRRRAELLDDGAS